jgi:hypothetical protein
MLTLVSGKAHLSLSSQWPNTIRRSTLRSMWACAFGWCLRLRSPVYEGEHLLLPVHQSVLHCLLIEIFHSLTCTMFLSEVSNFIAFLCAEPMYCDHHSWGISISKLQIHGHYHWDRWPGSHQVAKVRLALPQGVHPICSEDCNFDHSVYVALCVCTEHGMPNRFWWIDMHEGIDGATAAPGLYRGKHVSLSGYLVHTWKMFRCLLVAEVFCFLLCRLDGMSLLQVRDNSGSQFGILNHWPHHFFCALLHLH